MSITAMTKDFPASREWAEPDENVPVMTRAEYLQFLVAVRSMGTEKGFFLVKVFASVDVSIGELSCLTVESCRERAIRFPGGKQSVIPSCLQTELLQYAERHKIAGGPVFVTRTGNPLDRSNIANAIRVLARRAGLDAKKCCPKALHRVYLTTQKELMERLMPVYRQTYENLLDTEQTVVAWNK